MSGAQAFELAFAISPIVFTGGIAQNIPGGALPMGLVVGASAGGLLGGVLGLGAGATALVAGAGALIQAATELDLQSLAQILPRFQPLAGGTLADFQIGKYPFANQAVAANATIAQPLTLSMHMFWPARGDNGGFPAKLLGMLALQAAIAAHGSSGGTYVVLTPAFIYTNLILTAMRDITSGQTKQVQTDWQLDFEQPLLTLNAAQNVQNSLMSKLTSGTAIDGQPSWSGLSNISGQPNSVQAPNIIPSATGTPAAVTSPFQVGPSALPPLPL